MCRLLAGAPYHYWNSLVTFESDVKDKLFTYDPISKAVAGPPSDIPWPALWVVANLSSKHRIIPTLKPKKHDFAKRLHQQASKLKRRLYFQENPSEPSPIRVKNRFVSACPFSVAPELDGWFDAVRSTAIRTACSLASAPVKSNVCKLVILGIKQLRASNYLVAANDKTPGFSFIPLGSANLVERSTLSPELYQPVAWESVSLRGIQSEYYSISN